MKRICIGQEKNTKVHRFVQRIRVSVPICPRIQSSITQPRWSKRPGGQLASTNLVHVPSKKVFHLTALGMKFVLGYRIMTRSGTSAVVKQSSAIVRVYERVQSEWRKVATGAAAVLALAMAYHVIFGQNGLTVYQQKRQETQVLARRLHNLQSENDLMKGHVDRLQNDPNAIEHQAREELHYTRPGEVIYTLPPEPPKDAAAHPAVPARTLP